MHDAFDALSDGMKDMLAAMKSWCSGDKFKRGGRPQRKDRYASNPKMASKLKDPGNLQTVSTHPLFRIHPETGRVALYIGNHVKNLHGFDEAEPLLAYLRAHSTRPEFTCRVNWEPGTLTIGTTGRSSISPWPTTTNAAACTAAPSRAIRRFWLKYLLIRRAT